MQQHRATIAPTLEAANFAPEGEVVFDTPTLQQIKASKVRGLRA